MKRLISVLLCVALAGAGLFLAVHASSGYSVGTIQSFTLSSDKGYTNSVTTKNADAITALKELLASAQTSVKKPDASHEVAAIEVVCTDRTHQLALVRSGQEYLLQQGTQYRKVNYSAFNKVVNAVGSEQFYKYRDIPVILLKSEFDESYLGRGVGVQKGTYSYRRLSGSFNEVKVGGDQETYQLETTTGKLILPDFDRKTGKVTIQVRRSGKSVWQGTLEEAKSYQLPATGTYDVYILATDDSEWYNYDITYFYGLEYRESFRFSVSGSDTHLGEVVVLRAHGFGPEDGLATYRSDITLNLPTAFHRQDDGTQIALFPVSYLNAAGEHWVEISCGGRSARYTINAKDKTWQRQDLEVSAATAEETINSQRANEEYERVIAPLRSVEDNAKYWSGRFVMPVSDDKVTTQFGMVRYTNGQPTSVRHGALDLAVPKGTPVAATGAGRVLYAGYLQLTGNTVLIEHGYGLKSWYYHMDSLNVKTGDMVQQTQVVGTVGSTGFSTGPHLHFGMSVNNVFINPYTAINTDLLS